MRILLETERLVLRAFTEADADDLVELDSDPQVVHFVTGGRPTPRAEIEDDVLPAFLRHDPSAPDQGFWAAEDRGTGDFLGWFHLRPGEGHGPDEPELGYRLRRSVWGLGLATEGSRALVDKAFEDPRVRRVLAETMVVNHASRRVMEKCGMSAVRVFHADWPDRIPGDELGDVEYAIDRPTWRRLRAGGGTTRQPGPAALDLAGRTGPRWGQSATRGGAMARTVELSEEEVRAFASLLSRISNRLSTYEQQTHEDREYAQEIQAAADDLLHRLERAPEATG